MNAPSVAARVEASSAQGRGGGNDAESLRAQQRRVEGVIRVVLRSAAKVATFKSSTAGVSRRELPQAVAADAALFDMRSSTCVCRRSKKLTALCHHQIRQPEGLSSRGVDKVRSQVLSALAAEASYYQQRFAALKRQEDCAVHDGVAIADSDKSTAAEGANAILAVMAAGTASAPALVASFRAADGTWVSSPQGVRD